MIPITTLIAFVGSLIPVLAAPASIGRRCTYTIETFGEVAQAVDSKCTTISELADVFKLDGLLMVSIALNAIVGLDRTRSYIELI
jgi:hypothetical protein